MSFAEPVVPDGNRRPTVVTASGYLLYLVAVLIVINAVVPLFSVGKVADALREAYANSNNPTPDTVATAAAAGIVVSTVIYALLAIGVAILAAFDLQGRRTARIITWVIGGLSVLCLGCGALGGLTSRLSTTGTSSDGVDPRHVTDLVNQARPSWQVPLTTTVSVIGMLASIAVIVLLATPAANAFFRRPGPGAQLGMAEPPYPNLPYPPIPGAVPPAIPGGTPPAAYPPYPTQPPTAAGQPPAPSAEPPATPAEPPAPPPPATSDGPPAPPSDQPPPAA